MTVQDFTEDTRVSERIAALKEGWNDKAVSDYVDGAGRQYVDLVMEGGGTLGIALLGYLYALEQVGIRFLNVGGTSAGSITALILAAVSRKDQAKAERITGYLADQDLYAFVDGKKPARRLIRALLKKSNKLMLIFKAWRARRGLRRHLGLCPGDAFLEWVASILEKEGITTTRQLTERLTWLPDDLRRRNGEPITRATKTCRLALITAEVTTETKVELPKMAPLFWKNPQETNPALYVRASMSVPYFFYPLHVEDLPQGEEARRRWKELADYDGALDGRCTFVDGGIMSNFPIDVFHTPFRVPSCPTFGAKLGTDRRQAHAIKTPGKLGGAAFSAARHTLDYDFIKRNRDYKRLVTYIDTGKHNWLDFELSDEAKVDLFYRGVDAATAFLLNFDWDEYKQIRRHLADAALEDHRSASGAPRPPEVPA